MCAFADTFLSSFIQCSIGFPYFASIEGKYEAGPFTFASAISTYPLGARRTLAVLVGSRI